MKIKNIMAREILDSRGDPTIEVELILDNNIKGVASIPSGASTGEKEALELRDKDNKRYLGKGVLQAVENVNTVIREALVGMDLNIRKVDQALLDLDATPNKTNLGANAILGVSLAALKAAATNNGKALYEFVSNGRVTLPIPMINIINGGLHAENNLDIQEFMIVPVVKTFKERIRAASEIFHNLKKILKDKNLSTGVGDEGGFAPNLANNEEAFDLIIKAIIKAGYIPGKEVFIAIDAAASSFYDKKENKYLIDGNLLTGDELIKYYEKLINKYPIISVEDVFDENDIENMIKFTALCKKKIMLVGDDYFVTNKKYLQEGVMKGYCNSILLKANQVGTISEMCDTIKMAHDYNYKMIISHRSGETEDTFIADLAAGLNIPFIKTGSVCRGERIAKYNRLLKIEEEMLNRK